MDSSRTGRSRRGSVGFVVFALAFLALGPGCSGGAVADGARTVAITLRDFRLVASTHIVPAGPVHLVLHNRGHRPTSWW